MVNDRPRKPELLAPAGDLICALAAYDAGADAVYAGLGRFNAREMGKNFSWDDMSRLAERAKRLGRRYYVTVNTLVKQPELDALGDTLSRISALDPDAVIVQDLGVVRFVRRWFPEMAIYGSTQMGIHNSRGLEVAERIGVKRVIIERQVTLDELALMSRRSSVELEVFVHGALCCSLSGACLFSSWMGGWSGNRGRCKQPCRRRYHGTSEGRPKSGFFFSTQDLYSLDMLDLLRDAGVSSLKIEGRLKTPDYVHRVVRAYRLMLDAGDQDRAHALGQARLLLSGSYGRRWSHGFATPQDMKEVVKFDGMGVSGQLLGSVVSLQEGGFTVRSVRPIRSGDRLRVQPPSGDEGPSLTAGRTTRQDRGLTVVHTNVAVPRDGLVYRVGEKWDSPPTRTMPLYDSREPVDLVVVVGEGTIEVAVSGTDLTWSHPLATEEARRHPLTPADLEKEFRATRSDHLKTRLIQASVNGDFFVPASTLKATRRTFWEWAEAHGEAIKGASRTDRWRPFLSVAPRVRTGAGQERDAYVGRRPADGDGWAVAPLRDRRPDTDEVILPYFCPEGDLESLAEEIHRAHADGIRRFRITSLYQIPLVDGLEEVTLTASYPLPCANSLAVAELGELGFARVQGWLELGKAALQDLRDAASLPLEIYRKGRPVLLTTRAHIDISGIITDSRGGEFEVRKDEATGLTELVSGQLMDVPGLKGTASYFDTRFETNRASSFNWERGLT